MRLFIIICVKNAIMMLGININLYKEMIKTKKNKYQKAHH